MLTEEQIETNKKRFLELLDSIHLEDKSGIKNLKDWLENKSDFFVAPASTKYHCAFKGGLCQHSLNVYYNLVKLCDGFATKIINKEIKDPNDDNKTIEVEEKVALYNDESIKIVSLLHDISKANFYETYMRNIKDENGNWKQISEYKVREVNNRFIYGNHEQNSEFMIHSFIPLTLEESTAILHHHAGMSKDCAQDDISTVYNRFNLAVLLHTADLIACYIDEAI